jgi:hypothetical protein
VLFAAGVLLDPARYYVILPYSIGHGKSLKPSAGLHAKFPRYNYACRRGRSRRAATVRTRLRSCGNCTWRSC